MNSGRRERREKNFWNCTGRIPEAGVVSLVKKYDREKELLEKEKQRIEDMKVYENTYSHVGWICGIDEAGRGPLAGPVVAGAVILPEDSKILWLNDSKQLSAKKREELYDVIIGRSDQRWCWVCKSGTNR